MSATLPNDSIKSLYYKYRDLDNLRIPKEHEIPRFVEEQERYVEIYKITNTENNKIYVGQTVSHMLNHGKYRRYGSQKRLDSHISEAIKNNKDKQCHFLNNAIRKYGADKFNTELIDICLWEDRDKIEAEYIEKMDAIFPKGYNLKVGGTVFKHTDESRKRLALATVKSLDQKKLERFDDVDLPDGFESLDNYDQYIRIANLNKKKNLVVLAIGDIELSFGSVKLDNNILKNQALEFIKKLIKYKRENTAKPLDDRETPHSNDNFADNNEHIASKDEYKIAEANYNVILRQRKEKKKFNLICIKCNVLKTKEEFRKHLHICRACERAANRIREEANKERYRANAKVKAHAKKAALVKVSNN